MSFKNKRKIMSEFLISILITTIFASAIAVSDSNNPTYIVNDFRPAAEAPTILYEKPWNQTSGVPLSPTVAITARDADGDQMTINFSSNYTGTWTDYQTNISETYGMEIVEDELDPWHNCGLAQSFYFDSAHNYVYVAFPGGDPGIAVYSWNNKSVTYLAGILIDWAYCVSSDGTYIYATLEEGGLSALSFDGTDFHLLCTYNDVPGAVFRDVFCKDGYIYVCGAFGLEGNFRVYTFNGVNFTFIDSDLAGGMATGCWWIAGDDNYLYVAAGVSGLLAYTFNGVSLSHIATYPRSGSEQFWRVETNGEIIGVCTNVGRGFILLTFNGATFTLVGQDGTDIYTWGVAFRETEYGTYIFVARATTYPVIWPAIDVYFYHDGDFGKISEFALDPYTENDRAFGIGIDPTSELIWFFGDDSYLSTATFDDGRNFRLLETTDVGTGYPGVWCDEDYTYVAQDDGLHAYSFDGSGSRLIWNGTGYLGNSFTLIDSHDDGGDYTKIWGDGTYLFVTGDSPSMRVYQFDGYSLTKICEYDDGTSYIDAWGDGTYIYAINYGNGIKAFSFDGSDLTLLDSKDDGNNYVGVSGDGTYIYAACSSDGIYAYDFDGDTLTLLDIYYEYTGEYNEILCDGNYIYVAGDSPSMRVFTFNGVTFTIVQTKDDGNYYRDIWMENDILFFSGDVLSAYNFNDYDFIDRDSTAYPGGGTGGLDSYDVCSSGKYVYAITDNGLVAYEFTARIIGYEWDMIDVVRYNRKYWWKTNVTDGTNNISETFWFATENNIPGLYNEWPSSGSANMSFQPVVNVTINDPDKDILEITFASNYTGSWTNYRTYTSYYDLINSHDAGGEYQDIWTDGTYVYVACMDDGLRAYTFDGNAFTLKATKDDGGNYRNVWGDGTYIYAACDTSGIRAYSFDGTTFTLLDTNYVSGSYRAVWGDGTYIFTTCYGAGIRAHSFDGSSFSVIATKNNGGAYIGVIGDGTYVYTACGTSGIRAYLFNGASFLLASTRYDGGDYRTMWIENSYIYATCMNDGLRAYTFTGGSFTLKDTINDGGNYRDVWADSRFIYTACETSGIRAYTFDGTGFIFETSYDTNPPYADMTQDDGGNYIGIWGDGEYIYAGCEADGVRAYAFGLYNFSWEFFGATIEGTNYFWRVYANDGTTTTYETYYFTTNGTRPDIQEPEITIKDATNVYSTRATLNCILFDGHEPCSFYFEYGEDYDFDNKTTTTTKISGAIAEAITGLKQCTLYYFRAVAWNRVGANISSIKTFITTPDPPSNFEVLDFNVTHANLSWTKGGGASHTVIVAKIGNWPDDMSDGRLVCNTTGSVFTDYDIVEFRSVYYRAWSYNETMGIYSLAFASATTSEFFFDLLFPTYLEAGDYILGFGMIRNRYGVPITGYIANTTLRYTNDTTALGPVYWNCTGGNYQVAMSTTTLMQGEYEIYVIFKDEFDTTYVFARTIFLSVTNGSDTFYVDAWIYYSFYDIATGTGLDDNFYKVYISYDDDLTAGDRVKGGKIGVLQSSHRSITTGQTYYMQIRDYNNNILPLGEWDPDIFTMHSVPPITNAYVSFEVTAPEFYVDLGIYMNQLRIKNMNSSTTYIILKRTDGIPGQILGRFIPPWEEVEVFIPDGYYNLTIDYYYNNNRTMYGRTYPWDPSGIGASLLIDTDTFYWIQGYNLEDVIHGIEKEGTWLYYSIFDMNTGTNLGDDFYKVYISEDMTFTSDDRIKGGMYKCEVEDVLYVKVDDYWNNKVYPVTGDFDNITIVHTKTFIDLGIPLNQFLIKNINISLIYFRMTNGNLTDQVNNTWYNRWIPPGESTELFVRSGTYNISLEYYYPHERFDINASFIQFENLTNYTINRDIFFIIRGLNAKIYFNFFNTNTGLGLPYETLQVYLNDVRIPNQFIETTVGKRLNLVIKDYYNFTLHDSNRTVNAPLTYVDLGLTFFSYKFTNTKNNSFVVGLRRDGSPIWWEKILMPFETIEFLPPEGLYNIAIYNTTMLIVFNATINSSKAYYLEGAIGVNVTEVLEGQQIIIGEMINMTTEFNYTNNMLWEVIGDSYYTNQTIQSILNEFRQPHLWQIPRVKYEYNDTTAPITSIFAAMALDGNVSVNWHSTDNFPSNVQNVTLYYKLENASHWKEWKTNMSARGVVQFTNNETDLIDGDVYYFKAIAVDKKGNIEEESDMNICNIAYSISAIQGKMDPIKILGDTVTNWVFILIIIAMIVIILIVIMLEKKKERMNEENTMVYMPPGEEEIMEEPRYRPYGYNREAHNEGPHYHSGRELYP